MKCITRNQRRRRHQANHSEPAEEDDQYIVQDWEVLNSILSPRYTMNYDNKQITVSISGGKDSTAMMLNLMKQGYKANDFVRIYLDTGWEHSQTYEYLDYLEQKIGPITRIKRQVDINPEYAESIERIENMLGFTSPMVRLIYRWKMFPNGAIKFCTSRLKLDMANKYFKDLDCDYVNLVGIRAEESFKRSKYTEWEFSEQFDCWTHRPLLTWTESDVIQIHNDFNVMPNDLYLNGWNRVGCYPCIYSNKKEIKLLERERIEIIKIMETDLQATFFKRKGVNFDIEQTFNWSKTSYGGKQFELFDTATPTCEKWGLCSFTGK